MIDENVRILQVWKRADDTAEYLPAANLKLRYNRDNELTGWHDPATGHFTIAQKVHTGPFARRHPAAEEAPPQWIDQEEYPCEDKYRCPYKEVLGRTIFGVTFNLCPCEYAKEWATLRELSDPYRGLPLALGEISANWQVSE
jgi:hypothetical protein